MTLEITIGIGNKLYYPVIKSPVVLAWKRRSTAGKLTFTIINDGKIKVVNGAAVRLIVNKSKMFFGFIFTIKPQKNNTIDITAYDQLRYLRNSDTYVYENKTASQFVKMVGTDYNLQLGTIENTRYVIPSRVEENSPLFDMIESALDITLRNTKEIFVLYDDFGKMQLRNISSMKVGSNSKYLLLDSSTGENYDCTISIDNSTYNQIKLIYNNEETGKREVYIAKDSKNINKWGILQYHDTLNEGENGQAKADALLKLYNSETKSLKLTKQIGDTRVRAGSLVVVSLNYQVGKISNFMMVESVTHTFDNETHFMDLEVRGGGFNA